MSQMLLLQIMNLKFKFKFKVKIRKKIPARSKRKNAEIAIPLRYLSNYWRILEMSLNNCEINFNIANKLRYY